MNGNEWAGIIFIALSVIITVLAIVGAVTIIGWVIA